MGAAVPKQLLSIGGRTLLERSVAAFDAHDDVTQLVVVLPEDLVPRGTALVGEPKRRPTFVAGGPRRQDSVANGMAAIRPDVEIVLVHDAARPFASRALIDRVIAAAAETGAAVPALAARDTVKRVDPLTHTIASTIPRQEVWLAQTPQGFRRAVLQRALATGAAEPEATDEAVLAERVGASVRVVEGEPENVKITTPEDLAVARARADAAGSAHVGIGYDLHRLVAGRPLVLAGVIVPCDRGPLGHSDGDVVCHALVDAMLGAAAAGDIGRHFPNTDPAWKDAAGLDLLARSLAVVGDLGWRVSNADVTVVLEHPKLLPHIERIRVRLAGVLQIGLDGINVKGKTNEGVDAVGRGEAIGAHAVVMLVRRGAR